jgi:CheY-like chemotaxis protein
MKVLIVDDDEMARLVAALSLESFGNITVVHADSGAECLRIAAGETPDCILLDAVMPDMDGPTTAARLQGEPATSTIPIIFLTAASTDNLAPLVDGPGVVGWIRKPFNPARLAGEVVRLLAGKPAPLPRRPHH